MALWVKIDDGEEAKLAERMIDANGVELCAEAFGDSVDPPILLVMGIGGSMLWWDERLCRMLADGGRLAGSYRFEPVPVSDRGSAERLRRHDLVILEDRREGHSGGPSDLIWPPPRSRGA